MLLLLNTMGCGRSRSASSLNKDLEKDDKNKVSSGNENNKTVSDKDSKKEDTKKRKDLAIHKTVDKKHSENKYAESTGQGRLSNNVNGSIVPDISENEDKIENNENTGSSPTKTIRAKPPPPPSMMLQTRMSNSQLEFFKMLDEKIEMGRDYTTEEEKGQSIPCN